MLSHVIYLGIVYALIFTGFYTLNGFLTLIFPSYAFIGFSIYYGTYALSCLVAPYIISRLNIRWCIIISGFIYVLYIGFISSKMIPLFLVACGITGLVHSFIWLSQGLLLSKYPDNTRNTYISIFFGILCSNIIFGNLISLIILLTGVDIQQMIWVLMAITFIGAVMSIFILPFSFGQLSYLKSQEVTHHTSLVDSIKRVFTIVGTNRGYLLIPLIMLQAFDVNVSIQILSRLLIVNATTIGSSSAGVYTAAMYLVYGFSALTSSFFLGKLYDKFGWKSILISYSILQAIAITGIMLISKLSSNGPLGLWITISFLKGITDNAIVVMINISIYRVYKEKSDLMLAFYRFTFAIVYVIGSVMVGYISYEWILLTDGIFIILSIIAYSFFHIDNIEEQFNKSTVNLADLVKRNEQIQLHDPYHAHLATIV